MCRLIDRPLRPMFQDGFFNEVQVLAYVMSYDGIHAPEPLAICAASAALVISDIPLIKPIAAVRVGFIDDQFVINPTVEEQKKSQLDLMLAGTEDAILMIEGYCDFLTEEQILTAIDEGHAAIKIICDQLTDWQQQIGKPKMEAELRVPSHELMAEMRKLTHSKLDKVLRIREKQAREDGVNEISEEMTKHFFPEGEEPKYQKARCQDRLQSDPIGMHAAHDPQRKQAHRWPHMRSNPPYRHRNGSSSQNTWQRPFHTRRNPSARCLHARRRNHGSAL